jgi:hemerythrin-like metal-binding protein
MEWSREYETGNAQVDTEHKQIFVLVQNVMDAAMGTGDADVKSTIDFLAGYTVDHFAHEERLMEESGYPKYAVHKKKHDDFVQEVLALRERVLNETDNEANLLDITTVVVSWLTDHVLGSDMTMAHHYRDWSDGSLMAIKELKELQDLGE